MSGSEGTKNGEKILYVKKDESEKWRYGFYLINKKSDFFLNNIFREISKCN